jgi:uncharacterized protein YndB with AHSA1/START domain
MTVCSVEKDTIACSMVITAEFAAPVVNVWQLWADPRLLERWWGPPGYPATFADYALTPGATVTYSMGAGEERFDGSWRVLEVDAPTRLVLEDADTDAEGVPNDGNGLTRMEVAIEAAGDNKTRMVLTSYFFSLEGMEQHVSGGFEEGMKACMSQIEALLAETSASA